MQMIKAIYFHANASKNEGSGHLMRMYALAEEARSRNIDTYLIGKVSDVPWITQEFLNQVFVGVLSDPANVSQELSESVLVWDSYRPKEETQEILSLLFSKKFLIADAVTPTQDADGVILLEASDGWGAFLSEYKIPYLEGREFVPIRKSHQMGSRFNLSGTSNSLRILIFSGGVDFNSFVSPLSHFILSNFPLVSLLTITDTNQLVESHRLTQIRATRDFDQILDESDVVITSASSSIYEVLSRRIPSGFVVTAPNQLSNRAFLLGENLSLEIGVYQEEEFTVSEAALRKLLTDSKSRRLLQSNSVKLVDGLGASRIIDAVVEGFIST